jgi:DNA-binding beta-propeller fold protein YncE
MLFLSAVAILALLCACACASGVAVATDYLYVSTGNTTVKVFKTGITVDVGSIDGFTKSGVMAASPDGKQLFVADKNSIRVINTAENTVIFTISYPYAEDYVEDLAVGGDKKLYVADSHNRSVNVYSTATFVKTGTISLASAPSRIALSPDDGRLYVTSMDSHARVRNLSVYDTRAGTRIRHRTFTYSLENFDLSPDGVYIYLIGENMSLANPGIVYRLRAETLATNRSVSVPGGRLNAVATSPDGGTVYVLQVGTPDYRVLEMDGYLGSIRWSYAVGDGSYRMAIATDGGQLFVPGNSGIYIINSTSHRVLELETPFFPYHVEVVNKFTPGLVATFFNLSLYFASPTPSPGTPTPVPTLTPLGPEEPVTEVTPTPSAEPSQPATALPAPSPSGSSLVCCGVPVVSIGLLVFCGPLVLYCRTRKP